jgi:hypothetical protein
MKRLFIPMLAAAAALLAMAIPASATPGSQVHHAGSCSAHGDFATCVATRTAHHPAAIWVHVLASPRQRVLVSWTMTCSKGKGAGGKSGKFHAAAPVNRKIRQPYKHPDSCVVAAGAVLSGSGHLDVWITYRD